MTKIPEIWWCVKAPYTLRSTYFLPWTANTTRKEAIKGFLNVYDHLSWGMAKSEGFYVVKVFVKEVALESRKARSR